MTTISDERFNRQLGIINQSDLTHSKFSVIGVGGIGSAVTLTLAKMGARDISVYDDDVLEEHNISNQTYPYSAVGKSKVDAMADMIMYMEGFPIDPNQEKYTGCNSPFVICGVDSMEARIEIFNEHLSFANKYYIDARMGGEQMVIYSIDLEDKDDVEFYRSTLHSDEDALPIPCTEKAIIYNTMGIASHICASIKRRIMGEGQVRQLIYDFKTAGYLTL